MVRFITGNLPLLDFFFIQVGFAFSQFIVLRAGVFSLASAGFAAIGAYTAGILAVKQGLPWPVGLAAATIMGAAVALFLSWPLARLRGVYQAIATVAFVQIVVSLNIYLQGLTGGAMGLNGIPNTVGTLTLLIAACAATYLMYAIGRTRIGRTFDAIRQDEAVAASLGVRIVRYQALAFGISGALAGLFGGLEAYHSYSLEPNQFGFSSLIAIISYVVLGGRNSVSGPVVGTALLILLPEIARPLADNRILVYGLLLIAVINFLPGGIVDSLLREWSKRKGLSPVAASATIAGRPRPKVETN